MSENATTPAAESAAATVVTQCPDCYGSGIERIDAGLGERCPTCKGRGIELPAAETSERQSITHQIGDVSVTIDLPAWCPAPHVELNWYPCEDEDARAVAAVLGIADTRPLSYGGSEWFSYEDGDVRAAVFLR